MKTLNIDDNEINVQIRQYCTGGLAILTSGEEYFADVTRNLPGLQPPSKEVVFLNADIRGSELEKELYDSGIIMAKLQDEVPYNFGRYDMVMLDMEVLKEYDLEGYEKFYNTDKSKEVEMSQ